MIGVRDDKSADRASSQAKPKLVPPDSALDMTLRSLTALVGGYGTCYGLTALLAVALQLSGFVARADAVLIATNLALLLFPALVIWAFATHHPLRLGTAMLTVALGGMLIGEIAT